MCSVIDGNRSIPTPNIVHVDCDMLPLPKKRRTIENIAPGNSGRGNVASGYFETFEKSEVSERREQYTVTDWRGKVKNLKRALNTMYQRSGNSAYSRPPKTQKETSTNNMVENVGAYKWIVSKSPPRGHPYMRKCCRTQFFCFSSIRNEDEIISLQKPRHCDQFSCMNLAWSCGGILKRSFMVLYEPEHRTSNAACLQHQKYFLGWPMLLIIPDKFAILDSLYSRVPMTLSASSKTPQCSLKNLQISWRSFPWINYSD